MQKYLINALPLVADALGRKYGVKVAIGGDRAYTDGKTIHIPALPLNADETALNLARGYLDHESSHLRHTDFDALIKANLTAVEKHVWNIIEDFVVERKLSAIYPGCAQNFAWLIRHVFLDTAVSEDKSSIAETVFDWLLIGLRSFTMPELIPEKERLEKAINQAYPELLNDLEPLVKGIPQSCKDTISCISMAREIVKRLQDYVDSHPQTEDCNQREASGSNSNKQKEENGKTADGDNLPAQHAENTTQENGHNDSGEEAGELGDNELDATTKEASDENPSGNDNLPGLKEILEGAISSKSGDLGEMTGKLLEAIGQNVACEILEVAITQPNQNSLMPPDEIAEIRRDTSALRHRLTALLQSKILCRNHPATRGKIDCKMLARLSVANPRIFSRHAEKQGINTAIHILLDASGSMKENGKIRLACQSCYAVAEALYNIRGVSVAVTSFPAGMKFDAATGQISWITVCPILANKQKFHNRFRVHANGGTPMAPALWWVLWQMRPLSENRKILLILTDGEPDNWEETINAIDAHHACGHEVYGVGILGAPISRLLPGKSSHVIYDLRELPEAMFDILRPALLGKGGVYENAS